MKNYIKYICLFLMLFGISFGQKVWATTETMDFSGSCWNMSVNGTYASGTYSADGYTLTCENVSYNTYTDCIQLNYQYSTTRNWGSITLPSGLGVVSSIKVYTIDANSATARYIDLYINGVNQNDPKSVTPNTANYTTPAQWTGLSIAAGSTIMIKNKTSNNEFHVGSIVIEHNGSKVGVTPSNDGKGQVSATVSPAGAGTVTIDPNREKYSEWVEIGASPNSGYVFDHWDAYKYGACGGSETKDNSGLLYNNDGSASDLVYMPQGSWDAGLSDYATLNVRLVAVFEETSNYSITYHIPTCATGSKPSNVTDIIPGSSQTLANVGGDVDGWTFGGWTTESSNYVHGTSTFYAKNSSQTINSNWDLYPVYGRYLSTGSSETFSKKTSTMVAGYYIITPGQTNGNAIGADVTNTNVGSPISVTSSNTWNTMTTTDRKAMWQIAASGTKWTIKNRYTGKYLALKRNGSNNVENNKIYMSETVTDDAKWTIEETGTAGMYHVGITVSDTYYSLKFYDNTWRASSSSESTIKCFFKHASTPAAATAEYTVTPCNTHTVTYAANGGTGALPVDGSSPYTVGSTVVVLSNTLTKTGYNFTGWSGNQGVGSKTPGQTFTMPDADVTLTAQWSAKTYDITLDNESPTTTGSESVTMTYNSSSHTAITNPVKTGYTFAGWWSEDNGTGVMVMNASNVLQANVTGYTGAGGIWTKDAECTLYAKWVQNHTLTVASVDHVTISATSPSVAEGSTASVLGGTTVTLTYSGVETNYYWCGWKVYKTGDESTTVTVSNNQFEMPEYDVTVSALLYGDLVAFCEPEVEITVSGSVYLTSYSGVQVYTTNNPNNLITVTCSDFGTANKLGIQYLVNGTPVAKTSSLFRLCYYDFTGATDYNLADGSSYGGYDYLSLSDAAKTAIASGQTFAIRYTPEAGVYNRLDNYTLRLIALDGSTDKGHVDFELHGRALPQKFVIAANIGGQWKAMPADWETSSFTATTHEPYPITVNTMVAPTQATIAPEEAIYSAANRPTPTQHRGGIRLETTTGDGSDGHLQAARSNSSNNLWRTSSECSTGMQTWYLISSDFGDYTIGVDPSIKVSSAGTDEGEGDGAATLNRSLRVYDGKITWSNEGATTFRILPVIKEAEKVDLQIVEWKTTGIVFMYLGDPDYKASVEIEGVLKSASPAVLGTALMVDEGVYEIAVSDLDVATNAYKSLYVVIWDGETEVGRKQVTIPMMVNSTTTVDAARTAAGISNKANCHFMDLVVLSGGKLSTGETTDGSKYTFKSLTVYGGGKFIMPTGNYFEAKSMYLRAGSVNVATKGSTPSTSYVYTYPQVYIGSGTTLSVTGNVINFDYLTNYEQYFGLSLPYPVAINATTDIFYPEDIYGAQAKRGSFLLRVFDSKIRAAQGAVNAVWVDVEEGSTASGGSIAAQTSTVRGLGYTMLGVPLKVSINGGTKVRQKYGIHRMKMDITSASDLATAENANASIEVTAYSAGQIYNSGWWLLGNPYMADLNGSGLGGASITLGSIGTNAQGQYEWQNKSVRYVTVPDDAGGATYDQRPVSEYTFPAFKPFYVQIGSNGTVTFTYSSRKADAPQRFNETSMPNEIETSIALNSQTSVGDTAHILIGDAFSDEYEIGDDLLKMPHADVNLFTISGANELFANALNKQSALSGIPVGYIAPTAGTYEFTVNDKIDNTWIKHLWLTDLDLSAQVDLLVESYEFETDALTNKTRFILNIELKSQEDQGTTTGVDNTYEDYEQPMKFIYQDKMYILRNGLLYDATGKRVREINK